MNNIDTTSAILFVDDNTDNLNVLLDYFRGQPLKILVAESGELALQQLEYTHPDLILLDVLMPGIDGFETCRRLKANAATQDIPVIFLTALTETSEKMKGFAVGGVDYIIKPFYDEEVLSRVNTHLTISRQKRQIQELLASQEKIFSILAHDLKTPLMSFLSAIRIFSPGHPAISEEIRAEVLQKMGEQAENVHALLENLLNWAQLQQGQFIVSPHPFDLSWLVIENISRCRAMAAQKQISLTQTIPASMNVYADANMISVVMRNLLTNALKFTPDGGTIRLSARCDDRMVEVAVSDSGIGIEPAVMEKLFRIDRHDSTPGTAGEIGTGLGLILCHDLVKKNGGNIWVESDSGTGTTFRFTLPLPPI